MKEKLSTEEQIRRKLIRWTQLDTEFSSWRRTAMDISAYLLPHSGRFLTSDRNKGHRKTNNIYDNTATRSLRTLGAGLMGGATSPARPWFRLAVEDQELMRLDSVKRWLSQSSDIMRSVFQRSNTYRALHVMYEELGAYGTAAAIVLDDYDDLIRIHPLTYGEYRLATDARGVVNTLAREFDMTVGQIVGEFGYENCSLTIQNLYDKGQVDAWFTIIHMIEPNQYRDPSKSDNRNMAWSSCYFEKGNNRNKFLRQSGHRLFRVLAPRWSVLSNDVMGTGPGHEALGDVKSLQHMQVRKAEAVDYMVRVPLSAPLSMKNQGVQRLPGGVSFGDGEVRPAFQVNMNLQHLLLDIQDTRQRIQQTFFTDMFLMIADNRRSGTTATEVAELHEEKLLMIGPVLERLHNELLDPLIEITWDAMVRAGRVPQPPEELQDMELKVEFVSMLAQAQRAVATSSVDRFVMSLGAVAQLGKPEVLDNFDEDRWADDYADMLGVDPNLLRTDEEVGTIRQGRAQQQMAAQQAALAEQQAKTVQALGNTPTGGAENALTDVIRNFSGYTT